MFNFCVRPSGYTPLVSIGSRSKNIDFCKPVLFCSSVETFHLSPSSEYGPLESRTLSVSPLGVFKEIKSVYRVLPVTSSEVGPWRLWVSGFYFEVFFVQEWSSFWPCPTGLFLVHKEVVDGIKSVYGRLFSISKCSTTVNPFDPLSRSSREI